MKLCSCQIISLVWKCSCLKRPSRSQRWQTNLSRGQVREEVVWRVAKIRSSPELLWPKLTWLSAALIPKGRHIWNTQSLTRSELGCTQCKTFGTPRRRRRYTFYIAVFRSHSLRASVDLARVQRAVRWGGPIKTCYYYDFAIRLHATQTRSWN